jgi:hypothetical protein
MITPKFEFRTGRHNPQTIYVGPTGSEPRDPREVFIGSLDTEKATRLAVEGMNAVRCDACPWHCPSCIGTRADCECYEHPTTAEVTE